MTRNEGGDVLRVSRSLAIPLDQIEVRATTSGGPGGQHANRSQTRIEVRLDLANTPSLGPRQRARLIERLGPVVRTGAGDERSQAQNRRLALERLATKLAAALQVDPPRRPTRPTGGSVARRLEAKRQQAQRKTQRRRPGAED